MAGLLSHVDPDGLLEYSVVFSDRSLNHMSVRFQGVMREISKTLKSVYRAHQVALVPGGGSYAMEAVARQFATGQNCLVIRNGWFSYRWTQIFEMGHIPKSCTVLSARPVSSEPDAPWMPAPLEDVIQSILQHKPAAVFAPHVETSAGMILPDDYIKAVSDAAHQVGALMVLDCIASGTVWVDMIKAGVDVLISAPQKGWSASPSCGMVMLSEKAAAMLEQTTSTSFACDLKKWVQIMASYEAGGFAYHATMPTDALYALNQTMQEVKAVGFDVLQTRQHQLGTAVRQLLQKFHYPSVAEAVFAAPSVIVSYTRNDDMHSGKAFLRHGLQIAAGVPLQCDEPATFKTFRIGLFGLDKLMNIERTVASLDTVLSNLSQS